MKKLMAMSNIALALVASAGVAGAVDTDPVGAKNVGVDVNGNPLPQNIMSGSDTMVTVIEAALTLSGIPIADVRYLGAGSSNGQRQLEGGYTTADQPTCTPNNTGNGNAGCQEVSPMSRLMDDAVCNDTEAAGNAESMGICGDSILVFSDNASYQSTSSGACTNVATTDNAGATIPFLGTARLGGGATVGGYTIGATAHPSGIGQTIEPWQDVLRIVYTGYKATDVNPNGTPTWGGSSLTGSYPGNNLTESPDDTADVASANRSARCNDPVRAALLNNWYAMFDSANCNTGRCTGGLRAAYRRDDSSGTTGVFLDFIDVATVPANSARTQAYALVANNQTVAATETHPFCDGGDLEGFLNNPTGGSANPPFAGGLPTVRNGDPIRKPCAAEDELCGADGNLGVVRSIRSVPAGLQVPNTNPAIGNQFAFPTKQCTRNVFRLASFASTSVRVCPDGSVGSACWLPVYIGGGTDDFNCINARTSRPPGAPAAFDGRVYNWAVHSTGPSADVVALRNFEVAQWRQNSVVTPAAGNPTTDLVKVCQEVDATGNIGCIVGNTTCTIGWSGQQSALLNPYDNVNEPFVLDTGATNQDSEGYLARKLYVNAIGGFENVLADCQRRNPNQAPGFCQGQVDLSNWLRVPANAAQACAAGLYLPLPNGPTCETHVSATCTGDTTPECIAQ